MRPQVIAFPGDIPVRVLFRNVAEYPYHWHNALEIIYVLQGHVYIGIGGETHLLKENNIAIINKNELHRINNSSGDNRLLMIQIDEDYGQRINPEYKYAIIHCCSPYHEAEAPEKYEELKQHIGSMVKLFNEMPHKRNKNALKMCLEEILSYMVAKFDYLRFGSGVKAFEEKQIKRFKRIYSHILEAPSERQGLRELAEEAGITLQHMSQSIKEKFGYTFQELLYCSKCENAARLLLSTDKFIPMIASECGFSDPKYLIKHFKLNYHHTPSEFRKLHKTDDETLASQIRYQEIPLSSALEFF